MVERQNESAKEANMAQVTFTSRSYFNAAQEHLGMAAQLLRQKQHFAAHYFAGMAVEEILRACSMKEGSSFDSSHSIDFWALKSGLMPNGSEARQDAFRATLDEINMRWRANQRYMTVKMLDSYLYSTGLDKIRGDHVKYSSQRLFDLANEVVGLGVLKWESNNRSKTS
jgi:hypothetical protein